MEPLATRRCAEEWPVLVVGIKNPHGLRPGGLRCGVCRPRRGAGDRFERADDSETGHGLHRCKSGQQTDGLGRDWPWPEVRAPGEKAHRSAKEGEAGLRHRDPVVPSVRGSPREREGRRMGHARGGGARRPRGRMDTDRPRTRAMPRSPDTSRTSSGRSRGRKWQKPGSGLEAGPPGRNIRCRRVRGPTARLRVAPRGSPQGSTN